MPTLLVPSWAHGKSANGARGHGIIVLFMGLHVLSVLNAAVFGVVHIEPGDNGTRTEGLRDSESMGKGIEPEDVEEDHLD